MLEANDQLTHQEIAGILKTTGSPITDDNDKDPNGKFWMHKRQSVQRLSEQTKFACPMNRRLCSSLRIFLRHLIGAEIAPDQVTHQHRMSS